jgi:hypothetical protein
LQAATDLKDSFAMVGDTDQECLSIEMAPAVKACLLTNIYQAQDSADFPMAVDTKVNLQTAKFRGEALWFMLTVRSAVVSSDRKP